jgi:hypothetical protein
VLVYYSFLSSCKRLCSFSSLLTWCLYGHHSHGLFIYIWIVWLPYFPESMQTVWQVQWSTYSYCSHPNKHISMFISSHTFFSCLTSSDSNQSLRLSILTLSEHTHWVTSVKICVSSHAIALVTAITCMVRLLQVMTTSPLSSISVLPLTWEPWSPMSS